MVPRTHLEIIQRWAPKNIHRFRGNPMTYGNP